MLASSPEADTLANFTSHYNLLEHAISCQLGPIAGKIIRILRDRNTITLKELANAALPRDDNHRNQVLNVLDAQHVRSGLYVEDDGIFDTTQSPRDSPVALTGRKDTGRNNALSLLTDAAIKELMARLVLHRVVVHDPEAHTYTLQLGNGILLHVLYPLIAQVGRRRYGEAGEVVVLIVRQLALVPWDAAIRLTQERCPGLSQEAVLKAATQIELDGWIEFRTQSGSSDPTTSFRKRARFEENPTTHLTLTSEAVRLCIEVILLDLLHHAIQQWLLEHYVDQGLASAVISVFLRESKNAFMEQKLSNDGASRPACPHGYPQLDLAGISPTLSPLLLRDAVAKFNHSSVSISLASVISAVEALSCKTSNIPNPLLLRCGNCSPTRSPAERESVLYRLNYVAAVNTLQRDVCERVIFARHGVLGVRLLKLLLRDHLLEDRTLAENAIATQPRTRETLHAMMRDGYVYLQEVPRSSALTEQRLAKNSIFLWGCALDRSVRPNVREQLAKTLHQALVKLREVTADASAEYNNATKMLTGAGQNGTNTLGSHPMIHVVMGVEPPILPGSEGVEGKVSAAVVQRVVQVQRSIVGLESCAASLMRLSLILDYYS